MKAKLLAMCLIGLFLLTAVQPVAAADPWQAGVAKCVITPQEYIWMSGYGGRSKPAEGKLHDIWAKALVLEDPAGERAVLMTLDLVGIDRDLSLAVRRAIEKQFKVPFARIALCTSHTHTGPVVGSNLIAMYPLDDEQHNQIQEYTERLRGRLIDLVGQAVDDVEPCRLSWANGKATFAVNRRNNRESEVPKLREEGKLQGPVDHDVPVLGVRDAEGDLKTVVFGYACHATVLSFYQWSGDYPGFAQIHFEREHPGCVAMFWAGCGADQNPLPRRKVELADEYGRRLAEAVDRALQGHMQPIEGRLRAAYSEIDLPFEELPSREELEAEAAGSNRYRRGRAELLLARIKEGEPLSPTYPYPVQVWKLGDGPTWVILGGEVVVDFSLRLKHELGRDDTWVAGYSNDVMAYIPSRRVWKEGGYEGGSSMVYYGQPSRWGPNVEDPIVEEVHRLAERVESGEASK